MKPVSDFSQLCQSFFSKRLLAQRKASPHTISAYAQAFRLLVAYAQNRLGTPPSRSRASRCPSHLPRASLGKWFRPCPVSGR